MNYKKIHTDNIVNLDVLIANTIPSNTLIKSNNLSDLTNISTARTNLGLGSASTVNIGDAVGTIPIILSSGKLDDNIININGGYF
jgi:hypothetical protein